MNLTIPSLSVSVNDTTGFKFHVLDVRNEPRTQAGVSFKVGKSELKNSQRNFRLPRRITSRLKECHDPAVKQRMESARAELAAELLANEDHSFATLRLSRGLSQTQLAELIGTSQPHIAKIEAGKVNLLFATAVKIAEALGVSVDTLVPFIKVAGKENTKVDNVRVILT